jgi:hypothetical protein
MRLKTRKKPTSLNRVRKPVQPPSSGRLVRRTVSGFVSSSVDSLAGTPDHPRAGGEHFIAWNRLSRSRLDGRVF